MFAAYIISYNVADTRAALKTAAVVLGIGAHVFVVGMIVITRRFPRIVRAEYVCSACGYVIHPELTNHPCSECGNGPGSQRVIDGSVYSKQPTVAQHEQR